jgi:hypothetical protein
VAPMHAGIPSVDDRNLPVRLLTTTDAARHACACGHTVGGRQKSTSALAHDDRRCFAPVQHHKPSLADRQPSLTWLVTKDAARRLRNRPFCRRKPIDALARVDRGSVAPAHTPKPTMPDTKTTARLRIMADAVGNMNCQSHR